VGTIADHAIMQVAASADRDIMAQNNPTTHGDVFTNGDIVTGMQLSLTALLAG